MIIFCDRDIESEIPFIIYFYTLLSICDNKEAVSCKQ